MRTNLRGCNNGPIVRCTRMVHAPTGMSQENECKHVDRTLVDAKPTTKARCIPNGHLPHNQNCHNGRTPARKLVSTVPTSHYHFRPCKRTWGPNTWKPDERRMASQVYPRMARHTMPPKGILGGLSLVHETNSHLKKQCNSSNGSNPS